GCHLVPHFPRSLQVALRRHETKKIRGTRCHPKVSTHLVRCCKRAAWNYPLPKLEARLQARYEQVVKEHLSPAQVLSAGLRALPGAGQAIASTQGLWRFLANERVSLPTLGAPLLLSGGRLLAQECVAWGLIAHDWSELRYTKHTSKPEQLKLGKG